MEEGAAGKGVEVGLVVWVGQRSELGAAGEGGDTAREGSGQRGLLASSPSAKPAPHRFVLALKKTIFK